MKLIKDLTEDDKAILKTPLEEIVPGSVAVKVKELHQIDDICEVINRPTNEVKLEKADYEYLKKLFDSYTNWNSKPEVRAKVFAAEEKLNNAEDEKAD